MRFAAPGSWDKAARSLGFVASLDRRERTLERRQPVLATCWDRRAVRYHDWVLVVDSDLATRSWYIHQVLTRESGPKAPVAATINRCDLDLHLT
jgi:hypothetical protein